MLAEHLDVRVAAGHHGRAVAIQEPIQLLRGRRREDILHVRAGRAVEEKELRLRVQRDLEARLERANEVQIGCRELGPAPVHGVDDDGRLGVRVDQRGIEEEFIVVSEDTRTAEFPQRIEDEPGARTERRDVAEADEPIDPDPIDARAHRAEGRFVSMEVGDQGDAHEA